MPKWLSDFPEVRVNIKCLLPLDSISFFPLSLQKGHIYSRKKKKKSFFLQGGQRCGALSRGWGCRRRRGAKGGSALRRGPTPATAERKREVGEKGNVSRERGGGGGGARPRATGWRKPGSLQDASRAADSERRLPWDTGALRGNRDGGLQRRGRAEAGSPPSATRGRRWANRGLPWAKRRGQQASY